MNLFNPFRRRRSAPLARERLQILLSHERSAHGHSDLVGILREEILAALGKHITVDQDNVVWIAAQSSPRWRSKLRSRTP
jgi:cell division topological specificity factor